MSVVLSEFEKEVLEAVKKIPQSRVSTYLAVANAIGKPKAVRAVANAIGKNPWAPIVPCHRVIRSNGNIGGYTGGVEKKIALLKKEGIVVKKGNILGFRDVLYLNIKIRK